jgi:hypothetical protein
MLQRSDDKTHLHQSQRVRAPRLRGPTHTGAREGGSAMQSFRSILVVAVAAAASPFLAAAADAQGVPTGTSAAECVLGCNMQKKACVQTGRTVALSCKQDCRDNSPKAQLGACMKACSSSFRTTKDACRSDHKVCIAGCRPAAGDDASLAMQSCVGGCGSTLGGCARDVTSAARTCITGCRSAPDRLPCLQDCASAAEAGAEGCATDFQSCQTSCP